VVVTATPGLTGAKVEAVGGTTSSVALSVKRATLTLDRTWIPYVQGSLTCRALSTADSTTADPRTGLGVKFTLTQQRTGGALQSLPIVAWLRSRSTDAVADETTITYASVESLLQDYTDWSGMQYGAAVPDTTVVQDALGYLRWTASSSYPVAGVAQTLDGSPAVTIAAANAGWNPGTTLWQAIQAAEDASGLWIRGDTTGTQLQRSAANYSADTTTHLLTGSDGILTATDTVSRDNPDWANLVGISYPNVTPPTYDYAVLAGSTGPIKSAILTRQGKRAVAGAATPYVNRMSTRGRTLTVTALTDLSCRPNQTWRVQYRGNDWTGKVQSVTFTYPEGLMTVLINI
jgi:hypothetical protein